MSSTKVKLSAFLFLFISLVSVGQEKDNVNTLREAILNAQGKEKLALLDSLSLIIQFDAYAGYDTIAWQTVDLALELEDMETATNVISELIYYLDGYKNNPDSAVTIYKKYLPLAPKMPDDDRTRFYLNTSNVYQYQGDYKNAIPLLDSATRYAKVSKNQKLIGYANLYKGQIYSSKGKYAAASQLLKKADDIFTKEQDTFYVLSARNALSVLYSQNDFFTEAEKMRKGMIPIAIKQKEYGFLSSLYANRATDLSKQDRVQESIKEQLKSISYIQKTDYADSYSAGYISSLIEKYVKADSLEKASEWLDYLQENPKLIQTDQNQWYYKSALKKYAFATKDYEKALDLAIETLTNNKSQVQAEDVMSSEKFLSQVYAKLGMPKQEAKHLKNYIALSDSINSVKNLNALSYYQTLYETERKDRTIELQENTLELLEKEDSIKTQWFTIGGITLVSLFGFILLFRARKAARKEQSQQADFSRRLILAQENERNRVAKDLHDSVGQRLSMIHRKAEREDQQELAVMTSETLDEVREISRGLFPSLLKKLGLTKSIEYLLLDIDEKTNLFVSHQLDDMDDFFTEDETLNFYRFIQESLTNVIKHANAETLIVEIKVYGNALHAMIKDNGKGFEFTEKNQRKSLGLKTMQERIKLLRGKFSIVSNQEKGTLIEAHILK
ncbi:hypothetical protein GCM10009117_15910 [Gangjinia marincola]|uniref:Histidine kinase n=1 Tax=Gangjinia marincola TaxID=578463 RepID=A0ABN1MH50_9FLAO